MLPGLKSFGSVLAPPVTSGSQNYTTPGTYSFTTPNYNTLNLDLRGAGGGSGGARGGAAGTPATAGVAGGNTSYSAPTASTANGGAGGQPYNWPNSVGNAAHSGGSGGTVTVGGGAAGGAALDMSLYGFLPGVQSGAGGNGGRVTRAWLSTDTGRPVPGTAYTVVVGNRGAGGAAGAGPGSNVAGNNGANGAAYFSWS